MSQEKKQEVEVLCIKKYSVTCTSIDQYLCTWSYTVARETVDEVGDYSFSPTFATGQYKWNIRLYPSGITESTKEYVCVELIFSDEVVFPTNFEAKITLSIVDKFNKEDNSQTFIMNENNLESVSFRKFVKKEDLLNSVNWLVRDTMKVLFNIEFRINNDRRLIPTVPITSSSIMKNHMSNYKLILKNAEFSDQQINVGGTKIKVHKCILAAHSPVFAAMFSNDMLENATNQVDITDMEVDVIKQLISFIYVGEVENIDEMADKLLIAADRYAVLNLKELCEIKLIDQLNVDNIHETIQLIDKIDTTLLEGATLEFITKNSEVLSNRTEVLESIQSISTVLLSKVIKALTIG